MSQQADVLCAGIIVADHVCSPIPHVPRRLRPGPV